MNKICICVKDIQQITAKGKRKLGNVMNTIKKQLNKHKYQGLTFNF